MLRFLRRRLRRERRRARALGWTSLALASAEVLMPRGLLRLVGLDERWSGVVRVLGVRELAHGLDVLGHRDPAPGIAARIGGDAIDGVLLGLAAARTRRPLAFAAVAASVLGIGVADIVVRRRLG